MLNLHVGPHKTATTYIQKSLRESRWRSGYRYFDISESRKYCLSEISSAARGELPNFVRNTEGKVVLSDENMIGGPFGPVYMYPKIKEKLKWANGHGVEIFFCIRPYHEIFPSSHLEGLKFSPYREFRGGNKSRGYAEVLADIEKSISPSRICVWEFKDFRHHPGQIVSEIAGGGISELVLPTDDARVSPGHKVLSLYGKIAPMLPAEKQPQAFSIISNQLQGVSEEKYKPYNSEEIAGLVDRYNDDRDIISDRYGLMTFD